MQRIRYLSFESNVSLFQVGKGCSHHDPLHHYRGASKRPRYSRRILTWIKGSANQSTAVVGRKTVMLNERENVLKALREKPLKVHEIMRRANIAKEEVCQSLF